MRPVGVVDVDITGSVRSLGSRSYNRWWNPDYDSVRRLSADSWFTFMLRRKTIRHYDVPGHAHELTFSCVHRLDLLLREQTREWLAQSINQARTLHGFYLWAYVFMPNHVHLLVYPHNESYSTQRILQSIKQPVGRKFVNRTRGIGGTLVWTVAEKQAAAVGRFWQEGPGYDRNVMELKTATAMGEYIHRNPVRRGLVELKTDWRWSSARSWAGIEEGPIHIDKESMPAS